MTTFDIVVVGSGGGPFETNLSAYLVKPVNSSWTDGIIALEAGSGIGTLNGLMSRNPTLFDDIQNTRHGVAPASKLTASAIYSHISCFLISHGHLDHVNGLVLSAGVLNEPEGAKARRRIFAAQHTLEDLETIFSDRVWPNLASWETEDDLFKLLYAPLKVDGNYRCIFPDVSVRMMPIPHGKNATIGNYESSAFFIRHDRTGKQFLFFGDVEPGSISGSRQTNDIWKVAARMIPNSLSDIFIECSWPSGRRDEHLYGHLSPEHLLAELTILAMEVVLSRMEKAASRVNGSIRELDKRMRKKRRTNTPPLVDMAPPAEDLRGALAGVRVYIIHCKDDVGNVYDRPIGQVIRDQVKTLTKEKGLGVEILSADQGARIVI